MDTNEEKFFNRENLCLLVEIRNLHSRFIYHGAHNALTKAEMSRMQEIACALDMNIDEFQKVSRALFGILDDLKIQGVGGVDYSVPGNS